MKKYLYLAMLLFVGSMMITSCDSSEDPDVPIIDPVEVPGGMYVLNEGNYYSGINGSLSVLDYSTGTLIDGLFLSVNKRSLGGTPNDMVEALKRLYICCTDENRVEIVDTGAMESVGYVEITQPREVCASKSGVYVSSYDGTVYYVSFEGKILKQSQKVGACLEGIAVRDGYVYVCNAYNPDYTYNTNVVKLKEETLDKVADITVASNPTQIEVEGDNLYVLSTGNYFDVQSQVQSVDAKDNVKYLCDATHMAVSHGVGYAINSVTDWSTNETVTEYFKFDCSTGEKSEMITADGARQILYPCAIAVDGQSCRLFISSYNTGASGYADYSANGFVAEYTLDGKFVKKYAAGVGPATMVPYLTQIW